ncbi:hypothetical protein CFP56_014890 [Quercus suber]|uniref:Uncharacterized protein n=1 Tax=Quercus suber TaxID=58331 RepID=A0AAW0KT13_QUESU
MFVSYGVCDHGVWESGADLNLNSSSTSGSGSDGEDYGIEKPSWGRNQGSPVLTTLSLSLSLFSVIQNAPDLTAVKGWCSSSYGYGQAAVAKVDDAVRKKVI